MGTTAEIVERIDDLR